MSVIVDTSVWSLALRRADARLQKAQAEVVRALSHLIDNSGVLLLNKVRQELLTGVKSPEQFTKLREVLRSFPEIKTGCDDFELAAELSNLARTKGIQASPVDSFIWAVCRRLDAPLFTLDRDFQRLSKIAKIRFWDGFQGKAWLER